MIASIVPVCHLFQGDSFFLFEQNLQNSAISAHVQPQSFATKSAPLSRKIRYPRHFRVNLRIIIVASVWHFRFVLKSDHVGTRRCNCTRVRKARSESVLDNTRITQKSIIYKHHNAPGQVTEIAAAPERILIVVKKKMSSLRASHP